jgi:hypothetical protein
MILNATLPKTMRWVQEQQEQSSDHSLQVSIFCSRRIAFDLMVKLGWIRFSTWRAHDATAAQFKGFMV